LLRCDRERGSAPVETIFAIVFLMLLVLGVLQVAFALYVRNVVASSAHEGARAAIELGRDPASARSIARDVVARSAGGLVRDLDVDTAVGRSSNGSVVRVLVTGSLTPFGPFPISIPFATTAHASRTVGSR
jgi:Flp pilus assembly protein TadG